MKFIPCLKEYGVSPLMEQERHLAGFTVTEQRWMNELFAARPFSNKLIYMMSAVSL